MENYEDDTTVHSKKHRSIYNILISDLKDKHFKIYTINKIKEILNAQYHICDDKSVSIFLEEVCLMNNNMYLGRKYKVYIPLGTPIFLSKQSAFYSCLHLSKKLMVIGGLIIIAIMLL